jgi:hypothetical protein
MTNLGSLSQSMLLAFGQLFLKPKGRISFSSLCRLQVAAVSAYGRSRALGLAEANLGLALGSLTKSSIIFCKRFDGFGGRISSQKGQVGLVESSNIKIISSTLIK